MPRQSDGAAPDDDAALADPPDADDADTSDDEDGGEAHLFALVSRLRAAADAQPPRPQEIAKVRRAPARRHDHRAAASDGRRADPLTLLFANNGARYLRVSNNTQITACYLSFDQITLK